MKYHEQVGLFPSWHNIQSHFTFNVSVSPDMHTFGQQKHCHNNMRRPCKLYTTSQCLASDFLKHQLSMFKGTVKCLILNKLSE